MVFRTVHAHTHPEKLLFVPHLTQQPKPEGINWQLKSCGAAGVNRVYDLWRDVGTFLQAALLHVSILAERAAAV